MLDRLSVLVRDVRGTDRVEASLSVVLVSSLTEWDDFVFTTCAVSKPGMFMMKSVGKLDRGSGGDPLI